MYDLSSIEGLEESKRVLLRICDLCDLSEKSVLSSFESKVVLTSFLRLMDSKVDSIDVFFDYIEMLPLETQDWGVNDIGFYFKFWFHVDYVILHYYNFTVDPRIIILTSNFICPEHTQLLLYPHCPCKINFFRY